MTSTEPIICLDISLFNRHQSIASYLLPHKTGVILIDAGPGSTREKLTAALNTHGYHPEDVTHVLLTHIHLDHAGAAGWFANKGSNVLVHPAGAVHMVHPEKLIASASRIYGDAMEKLWGEFFPVPEKRLVVIQDGEEFVVGDVRIKTLFTPGHAEHHVSYQYLDTCFTGDVAGMRKPGHLSVNMPIVPPETDIKRWGESLLKLKSLGCGRLALSHYGFFSDVEEHLTSAQSFLTDVSNWLEFAMQGNPGLDGFRDKYIQWLQNWGKSNDWWVEKHEMEGFLMEARMGAVGLYRYWNKVRLNDEVI
jgi:glyoxylase-like metal-dependent hydrolase (beta-lactamase superfamily II)